MTTGSRAERPRTSVRVARAILLASNRFEFPKGGVMRRIVASSVFLAIAADHPPIGGATFPGSVHSNTQCAPREENSSGRRFLKRFSRT
nr:MAG TPA: hypothetical protein [Caudoviricetes sp.]